MGRIAYKGYFSVEIVESNGIAYEVVRATDSVAVLIHITDTDEIVVIDQCRAAYMSDENPTGMIRELVAGRIDRVETPMDIAIAESREEAGIDVTPDQVRFINGGDAVTLCIGLTTEKSHLAYVAVTSNQVSKDRQFGLAAEGECITRHLIPRAEFETMQCQTATMLILQQWLINNIMKEL